MCSESIARFKILPAPPFFGLAMLLVLAFFPSSVAAQQTTTIEKIEFIGLKRLKSEQVIALSGLKIGQTIDPAILDAAGAKLMNSGLFRRLSYRVRTSDYRAIVTFDVEESAVGLPVVFENFVWFSDEEIQAAVRRDVPFFNGVAPATGDTAAKIAASLQHLLDSKHITARVEYLPYVSKDKQELVFTVTGVRIPICTLHFPGAAAISEAELIKASQPLFTADYSSKDVSVFAPTTLLPLYRRIGHLRAQFQSPTVALQSSAQCANGVAVTIPVDEGAAYFWSGSEWNGNEKLTVDDLASALGMNPGDLADGLKIDKGLKEVRHAYARRGYMAAQIKETAEFEENSTRVRYIFNINEGPRYFMGNLILNGLAPADAESLKSKWTLGTNAVFDESYLEQFRDTAVREFMTQRLRAGARRVQFETRPNAQKLTVDVVITFK